LDIETDAVMEGLRQLIAEEMYLLGRELEDSLDGGQPARLEHLIETLDAAAELLARHQAARPNR